jgi:small subunit ribosomal protein S18
MARPRRTSKRDAPERKPKKKVSILDTERIVWVDYKDVALLRRFMSERAKIRARRVTGNDAQQQRAVARAIRVAREMALLPYSVRQVTHRNKGKRDRGDGGTLSAPRNEPMPTPPAGDNGPEAPAPDLASPEMADVEAPTPEPVPATEATAEDTA